MTKFYMANPFSSLFFFLISCALLFLQQTYAFISAFQPVAYNITLRLSGYTMMHVQLVHEFESWSVQKKCQTDF